MYILFFFYRLHTYTHEYTRAKIRERVQPPVLLLSPHMGGGQALNTSTNQPCLAEINAQRVLSAKNHHNTHLDHLQGEKKKQQQKKIKCKTSSQGCSTTQGHEDITGGDLKKHDQRRWTQRAPQLSRVKASQEISLSQSHFYTPSAYCMGPPPKLATMGFVPLRGAGPAEQAFSLFLASSCYPCCNKQS